MSWVAKAPLVYDDSLYSEEEVGECMQYGHRKVSDATQITRALISIANSLAILANETEEISPIVEAGFIIGGPPTPTDEEFDAAAAPPKGRSS